MVPGGLKRQELGVEGGRVDSAVPLRKAISPDRCIHKEGQLSGKVNPRSEREVSV